MVGEESAGNITITITGSSLHFHRDANFWFETTITLSAEKSPKKLRATIDDCPSSQAESIGKVVGAIFKIEGETLTLAAYDISEEPPKDFDGVASRYVVKKGKSQPKSGSVIPSEL